MTNERRHLVLCSTRRVTRRPYMVRWQDEDVGWKHIHVVAHSEQEARDMIGDLVQEANLLVRAI